MIDKLYEDAEFIGGVLTLGRFAGSPEQTKAASIIEYILRLADSAPISSVVCQGLVIEGNEAWRRLRLPFALSFRNCILTDKVQFDATQCEELLFEECRFSHQTLRDSDHHFSAAGAMINGSLSITSSSIGSIDIHEAVVHGHVTLRSLEDITFLNLDRMRVECDVTIQEIKQVEVDAHIRGSDKRVKEPVWQTILRSLTARTVAVRDCEFSRGIDMYGVRAESILVERCRVGTARLNTYGVPTFPTLDNSILGGEATLLMSSVEARSVQVGAKVWVGGDVRMLNLHTVSLRVGTDTDWSKRKNGVPPKEAALTIDGGIFYAKDARSKRTEIQLTTSDGISPSMLLNDADLGDLSIYNLKIGGIQGYTCLYGTSYSNLELKELIVEPSNLRIPRYRGDTEIPSLLVIRNYAYALRFATLDKLPGHQPDASQERERTKFRGQPYLALSRHLAVTGDSNGARQVLICMQDDTRKLSAMPWPSKLWNWISGFTVKYGYSVHRTVLPLILMILVAGAVVEFGRVNDSFMALQPGLIADNATVMGEPPMGPLAQKALLSSECTRLYPCMETPAYTLNMLLPFGNFTQVGYWQPNSEWVWRHVLTFLVAGVWIATTILLAALSGIARRTPET